MAISTYCFLNTLPSLPSKKSLVPRNLIDDKERSRRKNKNVIATIACVMAIGLDMENITSNNFSEGFYPKSSDQMTFETNLILDKSNKQKKVARWSDKRLCPPWHTNSLETIVPENLPRPSFDRRKWEGVAFSTVQSAPLIKSTINSKVGCFTM